jgi:hypothetical protein
MSRIFQDLPGLLAAPEAGRRKEGWNKTLTGSMTLWQLKLRLSLPEL